MSLTDPGKNVKSAKLIPSKSIHLLQNNESSISVLLEMKIYLSLGQRSEVNLHVFKSSLKLQIWLL